MTSSPKVKRERNPEETRRRILDAAEIEFARKGYDGTRLRDVALSVGVHHALLHHYFKDKEGLFRAVLERSIGSLSARALELLQSTGDVRDLARSFVETLVDFLVDHPHLVLIMHFSSLDLDSPAYAVCEELAFRFVRPLVDATSDVIRSSQSSGVLRDDVDPKAVLIAALGAVTFPYHADKLVQAVFGRDTRSPEEVTRYKKMVVSSLLEGILKR
jgi:TetR/AcrR family transcriptional regulator